MKVYPYTHDPMLTLAYLPDEAIDLFGQAHFDEYGIEIPDGLASRINKAYEELIKASKELKQLTKENL